MHAVSLVGAVFFGAIALALLWAILTPSVRDGIVIKAGMIVALMGSGSLGLHLLRDGPEADDVQRSMILMVAGTVIVGIGLVWRRAREKATEEAP